MAYKFNPFIGNLDNAGTAPDLSGYVPYTGAGSDVDLGTHKLTAATFKLTTSPTAGKVLTSDSAGNGTWQSIGSGSGEIEDFGSRATGSEIHDMGARV